MTDQIAMFCSGPIETNAIVVHCEKTKAAAIIDPAPDSLEKLKDYVRDKGLRVEKILITHSHWDHIADCAAVKEEFNVPVYVHRQDAGNLEHPGSDGLASPVEIIPVKPDGFLDEGDIVQIGELKLEVLHTPGHSPGQICFYIEQLGALIVGDHIFQGGMGTLSAPTAEPEKMWVSLARIATLPPETVIYPGHWETTTIGEETWLQDIGK